MREFKFNTNILIVDDNVSTGRVTLSWDLSSTGPIWIWYRENGKPWVRAIPRNPYLPGDWPKDIIMPAEFRYRWRNPDQSEFVSLLGVLEAVAFSSYDDDPNSDFPRTEVASARCLILTRNQADLNNERFFPKSSGTSVSVRTRREPGLPTEFADRRSFAIFQVGLKEPIQDPNKPRGMFEFADPPILTAIDNYNLLHEMEIADRLLFPGNVFWGLLTLVDHYGQWQCYKFQFATLRRKVVVTFDEIHIVNDGSEQHNDAAFYVWLTEGWIWDAPNSIYIPELEITDRPTPGDAKEWGMEHIKLIGPQRFAGPITLGPKVIVPEQDKDDPNFDKTVGNERIAALAYGIAEGDGVADPHDRAANFVFAHVLDGIRPKPENVLDGFLRFPVGSRYETVTGRRFSFRCKPQTVDNEFEFALHGTYSVSYEL